MDIERIRERDELGELMSLAIFSLSLPQGLASKVDALSVFTGQGEDIRITQAARKYWESPKTKNRFFLVPGYNQGEETWKDITKEVLSKEPFSIKKLDGVYTKRHCRITTDQADWTINKIKDLGITSCGIVDTPFHLLRAYTTTIQKMQEANIKIPLIPIPIFITPEKDVPESKTKAWDLIQGEAERILLYQKKNDVISYESFKDYINWLWEQPIIKKFL